MNIKEFSEKLEALGGKYGAFVESINKDGRPSLNPAYIRVDKRFDDELKINFLNSLTGKYERNAWEKKFLKDFKVELEFSDTCYGIYHKGERYLSVYILPRRTKIL